MVKITMGRILLIVIILMFIALFIFDGPLVYMENIDVFFPELTLFGYIVYFGSMFLFGLICVWMFYLYEQRRDKQNEVQERNENET